MFSMFSHLVYFMKMMVFYYMFHVFYIAIFCFVQKCVVCMMTTKLFSRVHYGMQARVCLPLEKLFGLILGCFWLTF